MQTSLRGPLTMLAGVLLFSTNGFWQAVAPEGATPYVVGTARLLIGTVTLGLWCLVRYHKIHLTGWHWKAVLVYAFCLWLYQILFFNGVLLIGVAIGTVISIGSTPIFAGLIQAILFRKKPDALWVIATVLAISGLILVNMVEGTDFAWYAIFLPLLAGLCTAINVMAGQSVSQTHSAEEGMALVMFFSTLLMIPFFFLFPTDWLFTSRGALCVSMLGVVNAGLAFSLQLVGLKNTPMLIASTLTLGEPMGAALIGIFILNEPCTLHSVLGITFIFLSIILLIFGPELQKRYLTKHAQAD